MNLAQDKDSPQWAHYQGSEADFSPQARYVLPYSRAVRPPDEKRLLASLLEIEKQLQTTSSKQVTLKEPLIKFGEHHLIGRGTLNIIQGAFGCHKSRLAEYLASVMLALHTPGENLGFIRQWAEKQMVVYVDTERNLTEELPLAIQSIRSIAGHESMASVDHFRYTSLKGIQRPHRLQALKVFLAQVRSQYADRHIFCVLDVATDVVEDFNNARESMALFDFLGRLCDENDTTLLLVIHQNPASEKARGHLGTEAANKASTVLQIAAHKDGSPHETGIYKISFLKIRRGKKPEPLFVMYSQSKQGLVRADTSSLVNLVAARQEKASVAEITTHLITLLAPEPQPKGWVVAQLKDFTRASNATVRERLADIEKRSLPLTLASGETVYLTSFSQGNKHYYRLRRPASASAASCQPLYRPAGSWHHEDDAFPAASNSVCF